MLSCLDLTWLEDGGSTGQVADLCASAAAPGEGLPSVAAVCLLPRWVGVAAEALAGTDVRVACAVGAFPSGVESPSARAAGIRGALAAGADEIDTVMDHRAFLGGRTDDVRTDLETSREACGGALLKVIVEIGALPTLEHVRAATRLAIDGGADLVKSSTGRGYPGATPEGVLAMAEAVAASERPVGVKVAGGVRTPADGLGYLELVSRSLGPQWRTPERFRLGSSSLLTPLVEAIRAAT